MFQRGQQHAHVRQVELAGGGLRQLVTERVDAGNGGFVRHEKGCQPSAIGFSLAVSSFKFRVTSGF